MTTWLIASSWPKIFARWRIASATLFSNPEYVCTTYQSLDMPTLPEDQSDDPRQGVVHDREKHGQDDDHDDHDARRACHLSTGRPRDPPELDQDIVKELANLPQRLHPVSTRPRSMWQGRRDSNPHPPVLESGALAVRATALARPTSLPCGRCASGTTGSTSSAP